MKLLESSIILETEHTGTCVVSMATVEHYASPEATRFDHAAIKRAAKRVAQRQAGKYCGYPVSLPRSDKRLVSAATGGGNGITWEENGRKLRAQIWSFNDCQNGVWLAVWSGTSYFPGEYRRGFVNADGYVTLQDEHSYNGSGKRAHRHDGSTCYDGIYGADSRWQECAGCLRGKIAGMIGEYVQVTVNGDPMYGVTCRWGTLREVTAERAVFDDDLADSAGIRANSGCYPSNGFALTDIREIKRYRHAV